MKNTKRKKFFISLIFIIIFYFIKSRFLIYGVASTIVPDSSQATVGNMDTILKQILFIVQTICYFIAVVMLLVLGVKYVTAAPEGKAEIKKSAIKYLVGATVVFAAGTILEIIKSFSDNAIQL